MRRVARFVPGVAGAVLVCVGVGVIFWPAAVILAGVFLLIVDRQLA